MSLSGILIQCIRYFNNGNKEFYYYKITILKLIEHQSINIFN